MQPKSSILTSINTGPPENRRIRPHGQKEQEEGRSRRGIDPLNLHK